MLSKLRAICDGTQEYTKNSKVIKAYEIVEKILSKNEKVIIFSYYIEPLKAMENLLIGKLSASLFWVKTKLKFAEKISKNLKMKYRYSFGVIKSCIRGFKPY